MTSDQMSFGPNATLPLASSFYFDKPFFNSRPNRSKRKKPQLSKLSILTKTSICSTKGTTKSGKRGESKFIGKSSRKNNRSKETQYHQKTFKSKENKCKFMESSCERIFDEHERDKQTIQRKCNLSANNRGGKNTKRRNNLKGSGAFKPKNMNKTTKVNYKNKKPQEKFAYSLEQDDLDQILCVGGQQSNISFETLIKTGQKKSYCQDRKIMPLNDSNDHLYSSAFIQKPPKSDDEECEMNHKFHDNSAQNFQRKLKINKSCQIEKKMKKLTNQKINPNQMQNIFNKVNGILSGYKQQCGRLKKQRDKYKAQYKKIMGQLKKLVK